MKNILLSGSADEIGTQISRNYERILASTKKWADMLQFDPEPETGVTPKETVWRKNKSRLYRYISPHGHKYRTPVLMLYALINKAYIMDLTPGMSLVEHLVDSGFDVYMLDWGEFEWEDRKIDFTDLVCDYIARVTKKVCQISNQPDLTIIGYCMGGTLAGMYASLFNEPTVKNLMLLSAPIDFSEGSVAAQWLQSPEYDIDKVTDTMELIPKDYIDFGVKILRPVNNYWGTYTRLWRSIDENAPVEAWKALNKWVNDAVNFPGEAYREWVKYLYQENRLVKNEFIVQGKRVDLRKINCNLLALAGQKDHLVGTNQVKAVMDCVSSQDKTYYDYPVGHGGLVFGNYAKNNVYPVISGWLSERSEAL